MFYYLNYTISIVLRAIAKNKLVFDKGQNQTFVFHTVFPPTFCTQLLLPKFDKVRRFCKCINSTTLVLTNLTVFDIQYFLTSFSHIDKQASDMSVTDRCVTTT